MDGTEMGNLRICSIRIQKRRRKRVYCNFAIAGVLVKSVLNIVRYGGIMKMVVQEVCRPNVS
nr:hypothetical protein Iba_chr12fCG19740 [Ipomoea batatas]